MIEKELARIETLTRPLDRLRCESAIEFRRVRVEHISVHGDELEEGDGIRGLSALVEQPPVAIEDLIPGDGGPVGFTRDERVGVRHHGSIGFARPRWLLRLEQRATQPVPSPEPVHARRGGPQGPFVKSGRRRRPAPGDLFTIGGREEHVELRGRHADRLCT